VLNVIVAGITGAGKSSFIDSLGGVDANGNRPIAKDG